MDRARKHMPVGNRITYQKHLAHCKDVHRKKLETIKSSVDTKPPLSHRMSHLQKNLKKEQVMEERFCTIERENRILLAKMSHIMLNKGGVDNINESLKYSHSLNIDFRRRNLMKITTENQDILKRIQTSAPTYDHHNWDEEYSKNIGYMKNITEYEYKPSTPGFRPSTANASLGSGNKRPSSRQSVKSQRGLSSAGGGNSSSIMSPSGWDSESAPRPKTSHGNKPIHSNNNRPAPVEIARASSTTPSMTLSPVRVPRSRDGGDVLLYNVARSLNGSSEMFRISVWDLGTTTARREDASKGLKVLAEKVQDNNAGTSLEIVLNLKQLRIITAESAVLTASLQDGIHMLDESEELHSRLHSALGMDFDPRLAMELGDAVLRHVMVKDDNLVLNNTDESEVPENNKEFWTELERK